MTRDIVVLERATPDNSGARRVAIPFSMIEALKYTEPLKTEQFLKAGFVKGSQQRQPTAKTVSARPEALGAVPLQPGAETPTSPAS